METNIVLKSQGRYQILVLVPRLCVRSHNVSSNFYKHSSIIYSHHDIRFAAKTQLQCSTTEAEFSQNIYSQRVLCCNLVASIYTIEVSFLG